MGFTAEELRLLTDSVAFAGGQVLPRGLGFGRGTALPGDVVVVDQEDAMDFVPPGQADGQRLVFGDLPGNQIHSGLADLDGRLTPARGLRRFTEQGGLAPLASPVDGRSLLIVHGTFSNSENIVSQLQAGCPSFLGWALDHYGGRVLSFDYPTLSQQAVASAMALSRTVGELAPGPLDVISHSQGGLVTRFWLEVFDRARLEDTRVVFVAGTLGGTSLAAPWALRTALKAMANVSWALAKAAGAASAAFAAFGVLSGLIALLERTTRFLSNVPAIDAGVAIVPGLMGMSQVATNSELRELQARVTSVPPGYFAITGDFEPTEAGWAFWRKFFSRAADGAADLLFRGPNDLVVDTASMTHLADGRVIPQGRTHHFPAGGHDVHHTNYFRQAATAEWIQRWLMR